MNVQNMAKGMNDVERHGLVMGDDIEPLPNGEYVLYTDYASLQQQLAAARGDIATLNKAIAIHREAFAEMHAVAEENRTRKDEVIELLGEVRRKCFGTRTAADCAKQEASPLLDRIDATLQRGGAVKGHDLNRAMDEALAALKPTDATLQRDRQP